MHKEPFVIEQTFDSSIADVWAAITNPEKMKTWYFDLPGFKAEVGYRFQFSGGPDPDKPYVHLCEVLEAVSQKKLSYSWRYEGYEGNSVVSFELFSEGNKTRLRLTHAGLATFPKTNPDLAAENFVAGWTHIIGTSLKDYLTT